MRTSPPVTPWHLWRVDADSFGIQNLGGTTVRRVEVTSEHNEVIMVGSVPRPALRPYEWFRFVVPRQLQPRLIRVEVRWRSGRVRCSVLIDMRPALAQPFLP